MNTLKMLALVGAIAGLASCNNVKKTENGLEYKIHSSINDGKAIALGDYVTVKMIYKTEKDSILFDSYKEKQPLRFMITKPLFNGELMEGFVLLHEGDSATFWVNADSLFAKTNAPMFNRPGEKIVFDIKVNLVSSRAELEKEMDNERTRLLASEKATIDTFLAKDFRKWVSTGTGLKYSLKQNGFGSMAKKGDEVTVKYVGKLFNGFVFDPGKEPYTFKLGEGQVIAGWDEALSFFAEGTKATLLIPSHLAYGERGAGEVIPPYAPLLFEVELLKVKHN